MNMARQIRAFVLAIALAAIPVHGGSRLWEPAIIHSARVQALADPTLLGGDNATTIRKRYLTINPGDGSAQTGRWADGIIRYCFEDKSWPRGDGTSRTTKEILFADLIEARNLWYQAGLSESKFKWEEHATCAADKRSEYLLIVYNDAESLSTTVGIPPLRPDSNVGPLMNLSDSLSVGMLDIVANYAHEMGHAWGMHHEHQNQAFWSIDYSDAAGAFFGDGNWNCQNLKDYDKVLQKQIERGESLDVAEAKRAAACKKRTLALALKFSASEYLPILEDPLLASQKKEPDWESIMLYPSGAGGTGPAAPGNDNRRPILRKRNGDPILPNRTPSKRDVSGLVKLYEWKPPSNFNPFGDKSNSKKNLFNIIRRREPDAGCS